MSERPYTCMESAKCPNMFDQDCTWIYPLSVGAESNLELTFEDSTVYMYTVFQNGRYLNVLLFTCKLALGASFLNSKFKRIFSLKQGNRG